MRPDFGRGCAERQRSAAQKISAFKSLGWPLTHDFQKVDHLFSFQPDPRFWEVDAADQVDKYHFLYGRTKHSGLFLK